MKILGVSAYYHDSAACLVVDGAIAAAAQEERFTRRKHDWRFPRRAIAACLAQGGLSGPKDLDFVVFYDKPIQKFDRLIETYVAFAPRGLRSFLEAAPLWLRRKLWIAELIRDELDYKGEVLFTEHHAAHAASAFFPSPFRDAAILTVDGVGEWATAAVGRGAGERVELLREIRFPHSLGLLYSAFTYFCGFKVNDGEYKLMGLAPYGEPRFAQLIRDELVEISEDGSFRLNLDYFDYCTGLRMTGRRFAELFGGPPRRPEGPLTAREMDLAASVQSVVEEVMLRLAREAHRETGAGNLALAGGVALNCVANGRILRDGPFRDIWIQPAAGDAGGALGAALFVHHQVLGAQRLADGRSDSQRASLLGPSFDESELAQFVAERGIPAERHSGAEDLAARVADLLASGKVVGWLQGGMEFGPRALGARSILADPRDPAMQSKLNLKIKFRESFRPFAPAVLAERVAEWFELDGESPYMLLVAPVRPERRRPIDEAAHSGLEKLKAVRSEIPAVTHVDHSARVQTVSASGHPLLHRLLASFESRTGCPVLVNTSFNVKGEPIVCTPADAYRCFLRTDMDALALGPFVIVKDPAVRLPPPDPAPPEEREGDWSEDDPRAAEREPRRARVFTFTLSAILALGGGLAAWNAHPFRAGVLAALAAAAFACAAAAPSAARRLFLLAMWAARKLSPVLTTVLLGLVFFAVLTPFGLALRLLGRRPLDLGWRDGRRGFWVAREPLPSTVEALRRRF